MFLFQYGVATGATGHVGHVAVPSLTHCVQKFDDEHTFPVSQSELTKHSTHVEPTVQY